MKITATALILASALVGTLAVTDQTFPPNGNQNVKVRVTWLGSIRMRG